MKNLLRKLFFFLIVKPMIFVLLGISTYHRERLPKQGPAIIVANHNSHLDTLVLISLFPLSQVKYVRPVAAADYFLKNHLLAWFAKSIIGIIPIQRKLTAIRKNPFVEIDNVLSENGIIIFFPEGTRGEPEHLNKFKNGIAHLAANHPTTPIIPVFLYGAGKSLPKGEALLVPFVIDVQIGNAIYYSGKGKHEFIQEIESFFEKEGTASRCGK